VLSKIELFLTIAHNVVMLNAARGKSSFTTASAGFDRTFRLQFAARAILLNQRRIASQRPETARTYRPNCWEL
jgi:hypothetical protein